MAGVPAAVEVAAYRIASEAMTNAIRHAQARRCRVSIAKCGEVLHLSICDDGTGLPIGWKPAWEFAPCMSAPPKSEVQSK